VCASGANVYGRRLPGCALQLVSEKARVADLGQNHATGIGFRYAGGQQGAVAILHVLGELFDDLGLFLSCQFGGGEPLPDIRFPVLNVRHVRSP
jgi:hypothetical protein